MGGDGVMREIAAAPVEANVGKVKKTNGALPWERKGDRGSAKVVARLARLFFELLTSFAGFGRGTIHSKLGCMRAVVMLSG